MFNFVLYFFIDFILAKNLFKKIKLYQFLTKRKFWFFFFFEHLPNKTNNYILILKSIMRASRIYMVHLQLNINYGGAQFHIHLTTVYTSIYIAFDKDSKLSTKILGCRQGFLAVCRQALDKVSWLSTLDSFSTRVLGCRLPFEEVYMLSFFFRSISMADLVNCQVYKFL